MHTESMKQLMQMSEVAETEAAAGGARQYRPGSCDHDCQCDKEEEASCAQQTELRWMASQLLAIQENERKRIAADLHDGLGQSLTLISSPWRRPSSCLPAARSGRHRHPCGA